MASNYPAHIAFFLPALNSGGAEKSVLLLAEHFAAKGITIDILLVKKEGAYLTQIPANVTVIELGGRGMVQSIFPLMHYLKTTNPNWLISGLPGPNVIALMARELFKTATKILITQHHPFTENAAASVKIRTKIRTALARFLFKRADKITAVSRGVATDLSRVLNANIPIAVVHNPLNIKRITDLSASSPVHPWLIQKDHPTFIAVGRLAPPKDYETILQALTDIPSIRLLIAGEGQDRVKIQHLIQILNLEDRVMLLGLIDNIYAAVNAADAMILSSHHEGFGNVLIEAMAIGTPIIASDCPYGPAEITENGTLGHLFPVGDSHALKSAMEATIKQPLVTADMLKSKARKYSIDTIAKKYLKLMRE